MSNEFSVLSKLKSLGTVSLTEFFFLLLLLSYKKYVAKNKPMIEVAIRSFYLKMEEIALKFM